MRCQMKYINLIFLLLLVLFISCGKDNPTNPTDDLTEPVELQNSTKSIEDALSKSDGESLKSLILPANLAYYKSAIEGNPEKLAGFNEIFKKRKLISISNIYAVYELEYQGKYYELTMVLDEDGIWKLRDL